MSDTQIFLIGVFASILMIVHVTVIFIGMRKLDDTEGKRAPSPVEVDRAPRGGRS